MSNLLGKRNAGRAYERLDEVRKASRREKLAKAWTLLRQGNKRRKLGTTT